MSLSDLLVSGANEGSSELVSDGGERAEGFRGLVSSVVVVERTEGFRELLTISDSNFEYCDRDCAEALQELGASPDSFPEH